MKRVSELIEAFERMDAQAKARILETARFYAETWPQVHEAPALRLVVDNEVTSAPKTAARKK